MLFHQLFVAAFVVVAAIAIATTGLHAKANLRVARGADATESTNLIGSASVGALILGGRIARLVGACHWVEANAHSFVGAGPNIATNNGAVAAGATGVANTIATRGTVRADGARVTNLFGTAWRKEE